MSDLADGADGRKRRDGPVLKRLITTIAGYRAVLARFAPYLAPYRGGMAVAFAATIATVAARLAEPWPLKLIVDSVFLGQAPDWIAVWELSSTSLLLWLIAAMAVIALADAGFRYAQTRLSAEIGLGLGRELRSRLFAHAVRLSPRFHDRRRSGDMVVRMMSDVRIMQRAFVGIPIKTLEEALLLVGMTAIMLLIDWRLTLIAALVLPIIAYLMRSYHAPMREAIRKQREREGQLASTAAEALSSMRVVQGFGREKAEMRRFGKAAKKDLRSGVRGARLEGQLKWVIEIAVGLATAAIVAVATMMIRAGTLTPGDLIVFAVYLAAFYRPLRRLSRTLKRFSRAASAGERVTEIMRATPEVRDAPDATEAPAFAGAIRFDDVALDLDGRPALDGITLDIPAGGRVTLAGPSGAGKTSLVSLLPRLIDPDRGRVLIDGADIRGLTLESLRRQIALAPQGAPIFAGTVAENAGFGAPEKPTAEMLDRAAEAAGVAPIIAALPDGWATQVGEGGRRVSGGQRQAVSLIRAMLRDAPILILDEPTDGLDPDVARQVDAAIRGLEGRKTVIIISHDMRAFAPDDRVVRLESGRVADDGLPPKAAP